MSQLLGLVTQMHGNKGVININYSTGVRMRERWVANTDLQNILESPIDGEYLCSDPIVLVIIFLLLTTHRVI